MSFDSSLESQSSCNRMDPDQLVFLETDGLVGYIHISLDWCFIMYTALLFIIVRLFMNIEPEHDKTNKIDM